jgi:hypothetical protein
MRAAGIGAWHNQYGSLSLAQCVERARLLPLQYIIVKDGYPQYEAAYRAAGIPVAIERFVYSDQAYTEGKLLADAVARGAHFIVVNAEEGGGWESAGPMRILLDALYSYADVEVYASVDTRGGRNLLPFQRELITRSAGVMPMIYPKAFRPEVPFGFVAQAFADCLNGQEFYGRPVIPTIQAYDNIGWAAVGLEILEAHERGLYSLNLYTIGHATDDEWYMAEEAEMASDIEQLKNAIALKELSVVMRDGLIADLLSGKYHVRLLPSLQRVLELPGGKELVI